MLLQMAFRNLRRNLRRTIITSAAVAVGMIVLVMSNTLRAGQYDDMISSSVSQLAGHVVVQHPEYQQEQETELVVEDVDGLVAALKQEIPNTVITTRTRLGGILASSSSPTVIGLTAVDPLSEGKVSDMADKIVTGEWVQNDSKSIVIGQNMADLLQADLGDRLVFTTSVDGEMNSHLYRLTGVFRTGAEEVDAFVGYVSIASVDTVLGRPNTANQVAVHLDNASQTNAILERVERVVESQGRKDVAVQPWPEILPDVIAMIKVDQVSNEMISISLMFIVAMGILNTMLMNVLERSKEFGVLMAIGLKKGALVRMILLEAALVGIIGGLSGAVLGMMASYPIVVNGLDLTKMMGEGMVINGAVASTILYGRYDFLWIGGYILLSVLCAVLSALYPAWKIQQLTPVDAMRS